MRRWRQVRCLVKTFLKGEDELIVLFEILSQKVAQYSEQTQDLSGLWEWSRVRARVGITTGAELSRLSLASWFLGKKGWVLGTKTPWTVVWCVSLLSMNLTPVLAESRVKRKNSLEAQCFKEASLRGSNGALPIGATPGGGSRRGCPSNP